MKRKAGPQEEKRRPLAETNLLDEPKRIDVRRRGCGPLFGSLLVIAAVAAGLVLELH